MTQIRLSRAEIVAFLAFFDVCIPDYTTLGGFRALENGHMIRCFY
jgi:hypothetical protein